MFSKHLIQKACVGSGKDTGLKRESGKQWKAAKQTHFPQLTLPHARKFRICPLAQCKSSQPGRVPGVPWFCVAIHSDPFGCGVHCALNSASKSPSVMSFFPALTNSCKGRANTKGTGILHREHLLLLAPFIENKQTF